MRAKLHFDTRVERPVRTARTRGMMIGLVGGLVGTIVMDLFGGGLFLVMGGPASLSFAIRGTTDCVLSRRPGRHDLEQQRGATMERKQSLAPAVALFLFLTLVAALASATLKRRSLGS